MLVETRCVCVCAPACACGWGECAVVCDRFTTQGLSYDVHNSLHHMSPNNRWNPWNYISLAILCKIFTFPHSSSYPPPPFSFLCGLFLHKCAHVCSHTQRHIHPCPPTLFSHLRCPSFVWAQKGQELRGRREEEEEVCGRMRGYGFKCFHSCLEHTM